MSVLFDMLKNKEDVSNPDHVHIPLIHHNAVDDCIYQARYISKCLKDLNLI
jgi:hypothetical protein